MKKGEREKDPAWKAAVQLVLWVIAMADNNENDGGSEGREKQSETVWGWRTTEASCREHLIRGLFHHV